MVSNESGAVYYSIKKTIQKKSTLEKAVGESVVLTLPAQCIECTIERNVFMDCVTREKKCVLCTVFVTCPKIRP